MQLNKKVATLLLIAIFYQDEGRVEAFSFHSTHVRQFRSNYIRTRRHRHVIRSQKSKEVVESDSEKSDLPQIENETFLDKVAASFPELGIFNLLDSDDEVSCKGFSCKYS